MKPASVMSHVRSSLFLGSVICSALFLNGCGTIEESGVNDSMDSKIPRWLRSFVTNGDVTIKKDQAQKLVWEAVSDEASERIVSFIEQNAHDYHVVSSKQHTLEKGVPSSEVSPISVYIPDPWLKCKIEAVGSVGYIDDEVIYINKATTTYEQYPLDYQAIWPTVRAPSGTVWKDSMHVDPRFTGGVPISVKKTAGSSEGWPSSDHSCCQSRIERDCNLLSCWNAEHVRCMSETTLSP